MDRHDLRIDKNALGQPTLTTGTIAFMVSASTDKDNVISHYVRYKGQ